MIRWWPEGGTYTSAMKWFARRRGKTEAAIQLSPDAIALVDQLIDHHHDREWPTAIGWYLPDQEPPWGALEELSRGGYCKIERDGEEIEMDFTELGRRIFV
ncbi:Uncharacterised protein [Mycobacteroides abscessus subsp. abscessus]|nr:Uncharacterised protein [Mycobacteroides abscessus subsp. abscessus]SKV32241.1 Uncharacterised protein [Mycobacteroides abscessus subsp. abscessus]